MIRALVFDLDDTLLDTSGILVPDAATKACLALMSVGASCTLDECLEMRKKLAAKASHPEIFGKIADEFDCEERELGLQLAIQEFYNPQIPPSLPMIDGVSENLNYLQKKYDLFLVTMGMKQAQAEKIKALNIANYFQKIYILDTMRGERKQIAFQDILLRGPYQPSEVLSIGNRLSAEIRDAKLCGCQTCYFKFGEHIGEEPEIPADIPDFTITSHYELIKVCNL